MARRATNRAALLLVLGLALSGAACSAGPAVTPLRTLAPLPTVGPSSAPPSAAPTETPAATETPGATETEAASPPPETESPPASAAGSSGGGPGESPSATPIDVAPYLTASLSVVNAAQVEVDMEIGIVADDGTVTPVLKVPLQPFDSLAQQVVAATYKITWTYTGSGAKPDVCKLKVGDGEQFGFTVADHLIAITKDGLQPTMGSELVVSTSSLCASS